MNEHDSIHCSICNPRGVIPGPHLQRFECRNVGSSIFKVPHYGLLEGLELFLDKPLPHMDCSQDITVQIGAMRSHQTFHFDRVFSRSRSVEFHA